MPSDLIRVCRAVRGARKRVKI